MSAKGPYMYPQKRPTYICAQKIFTRQCEVTQEQSSAQEREKETIADR